MKHPKDLADRWCGLRQLRRLEPDVILRETITLPLHAAILEARKIIGEHPVDGCMTIVENWRQRRPN